MDLLFLLGCSFLFFQCFLFSTPILSCFQNLPMDSKFLIYWVMQSHLLCLAALLLLQTSYYSFYLLGFYIQRGKKRNSDFPRFLYQKKNWSQFFFWLFLFVIYSSLFTCSLFVAYSLFLLIFYSLVIPCSLLLLHSLHILVLADLILSVGFW